MRILDVISEANFQRRTSFTMMDSAMYIEVSQLRMSRKPKKYIQKQKF